jgi:hypothetical protein
VVLNHDTNLLDQVFQYRSHETIFVLELISHMLNNQEDIERTAGCFMENGSIGDSLRRLAIGEATVQVNTQAAQSN